MEPHPIQLAVEDDLRRTRITVFFRLILAIPLFIWAVVWSIGAFFAAIVNWFVALVTGRPAASLHTFLSRYIRFLAHFDAYLWLVADPYPGFAGEEGTYPVDVTLPPPVAHRRWTVLLRLLLAIPAFLVSATLGGSIRAPYRRGGGGATSAAGSSGALAAVCAILGWFASLFTGRMPKGLRDAGAYSVGYSAQTLAYALLVTDRYPNSDPTAMLAAVERPPLHPVRMVGDAHDLRRSRVLVLFRLPLAIPHVVWLFLWNVAAIVVGLLNWFVTLFRGTPSPTFHRFLVRFTRYQLHVYAFLFLAANPFPGFVGAPNTYPLDLELPGPERQNRWITGFRIVLAVPAIIVNSALSGCIIAAAVLTWFAALVTGFAPWGLRNLSAYSLRYQVQYTAYLYLVTDAYPHASPLEGAAPDEPHFADTA